MLLLKSGFYVKLDFEIRVLGLSNPDSNLQIMYHTKTGTGFLINMNTFKTGIIVKEALVGLVNDRCF